MNKLNGLGRRAFFASVALLLGAALTLPTLFSASAAAAPAQVTIRKITMSSSAPGATGVSYVASFNTATTGNIRGVVIDFCANTPLPSDTCSTGAGTTLDGFTIGASPSVTNTGLAGTWVTTSSTAHTLIYSNSTGGSVSSGSPITITISNVTNPTSTNTPAYPGSFYARILTYATDTAATAYTSTIPGSYVDYGGIALSTVQNISITAKVFETLSFCVFETACGTTPSLTLGDATTGALSTGSAYVNADAKYTLSTNAGTGVSVVMKGTTLCNTVGAPCQSGSPSANTITPVSTTPVAFNSGGSGPGNEAFGMCADKNGSAALTVDPAYVDSVAQCHGLSTGIIATADTFGFDNANVVGASGSEVIHSALAVPSVTGGFAFAANIAPTTEAGIYMTSLNMIATSTF